MDRFSFKKLEYHKVREMLESHCQTPLGVPHVRQMEPSSVLEEILRWQAETSEAVDIMRLQPEWSLAGVSDLSPVLRRASIGGILEPEELLCCRGSLSVAGRARRVILDIEGYYPNLQERAALLKECRPLQDRIDFCITPDGEIADSASPELSRLRRQIRSMENRVREELDRILSRQEWLKYLQEPIYTMRGERYVVPVKAEYRSQFPGIVHDQSSSGATVFMEPLPLVKLMNELATARSAEQQEVVRILDDLTRLVASYQEDLAENMRIIGELDFIFARGALSARMRGTEPRFSQDGHLVLHRGRHPLLQGEVVPLDLHLGQDFDCLIITGPNTGGKTVALKTVGLICLMAQSGLHIPAAEGTILTVFNNIFADIGDEQSIEQSLSTFSGHLTNIVRILQSAGRGSLVILDELGAGTDPEQGASLGMAILEYLMKLGCLIITTTHYSELKVFAHTQPRAENASVEFDSKTLRPTYRLAIGVPGESNAFEIAGRLGLPAEIIDRARSLLRPEQRELADLIQQLKEDRFAASTARSQAEKMQAEMEKLRERVRQEEERLREKERRILEKAAEEARELVRTARREAEQLIRSLKEEQKQRSLQDRLETAREVRWQISELADKVEKRLETKVQPAPGVPVREVAEGDRVLVPRFNQEGCVMSRADESGEVLVQIGSLKLKLPVSELRKPSGAPPCEQQRRDKRETIQESAAVSAELDFRGQRVEEALEILDKYLDSAYLAGIPRVRLIHGKGTGVLRDVVQKYLAKHPFVASYRLGAYNEGGSGVTVVQFK